MTRTALFTFDDESSTGINKVPVPCLVNIKDVGGAQVTVYFISSAGLTDGSTIRDMMAIPTLYKVISKGAKHTFDIKKNTMHIEIF